MKPCAPLAILAAAGLLVAAPAAAQPPASAPAAEPQPQSCAERARIEAEHVAVKRAIADYALGGSDRRGRRRGAQAGKTAAQAALGLFLPFGVGLAMGGGVALAEAADRHAKAKRPKPPPPPEPDVPAMIARQQQLEAELAALDRAGCPAAVAAAPATDGARRR